MALISATITISTIGVDAGPFTVSDGLGNTYTNVSRASLLSGYTNDFDDAATDITVTSTGVCTNDIVIPFSPPPKMVPINLEIPDGIFYTSCLPQPDGWATDVYMIVNGNIELTDSGSKTILVPEGSNVFVDMWVDDGYYVYNPGAAYNDCGKSVAPYLTASVNGTDTLIDGTAIEQGPTPGSATPYNSAASYSFIANFGTTYLMKGYVKDVTSPVPPPTFTQLSLLYAICNYNPGTSGTTDADVYISDAVVAGGSPYIATGVQLYLSDGSNLNDAVSIADEYGVIYNISSTGLVGTPTGTTC